jgi:hypothetical protein
MEAMMNLHSKIQSGAKAALTGEDRAASIDWSSTAHELANYGAAVLPSLLAAEECREIAALYQEDSKFRNHIVMARHGFGKASPIRFPSRLTPCAPPSTPIWRPSPTSGTAG